MALSQVPSNLWSMLQEYDYDSEVYRQRFRQFQYSEAAGPQEAFSKLWELCSEWLKPKMRSMEQILGTLVLEQFLTILPTEMETWLSLYGPEDGERNLDLTEGLKSKCRKPEQEVYTPGTFLKEMSPAAMVPMTPSMHVESPAVQVMGPVQEAPVAEAWIPQAAPWELNYGAAEHCQPFPDPGHATPENYQSCALEDWGKQEVQRLLLNSEPLNLPPAYERDVNAYHVGHFLNAEDPQKFCLGEMSNSSNQELDPEANSSNQELDPEAPEPKSPEKKLHRCGQCGQCCSSTEVLSSHLKSHVIELNYQVSQHRQGLLQQSPRDQPEPARSGKKPYECSVCKRGFTKQAYLTVHQREHCGKHTHQCPQCSKSFSDRTSLKAHQKIHILEKPHVCPSCGKSFRRRRELTRHLITHTDERPFTCEYCQKTYRHKHNLRAHIRSHTGENLYVCNICSKKFMRKEALDSHQAEHSRGLLSGNLPKEMSPSARGSDS